MHFSVFKFFMSYVSLKDIEGKRVLDIGSYNVNGSLKSIIQPTMNPASYIGVDIRQGPDVDKVTSAESLLDHFSPESFDVVIFTEAFEHIENWREALNAIKYLMAPNGMIIFTTRSKGFPLHDYPSDYWRVEWHEARQLFEDFNIEVELDDWQQPGIFIKAIKPGYWRQPADLSAIELYRIEG